MQQALLFLVRTLADLYILAFVLRFVFQLIRIDYDNPLVVPARRMLPSIRRVDLPTLIVIVALECVATLLLLLIVRYVPTAPQFLAMVVLRLVGLVIWFYIVTLFVYVALGWFAAGTYHPMLSTLSGIVAPVLRPVRRILPPIGGMDLSAILVTILLIAIRIALPQPI